MADTINAGTMLIDEGALMQESLRFEKRALDPFLHGRRNHSRIAGWRLENKARCASESNTAHSDEVY